MTFPDFGECIGVVFLFYQDLIKDTFLLSKMVLSVGGLAYAFNLTTFASLVSLKLETSKSFSKFCRTVIQLYNSIMTYY